MKLTKIIITILLIINSLVIGKNTLPTDFTKEQKIYGLITIWSEVKFGFPYPKKLQELNWDQKVQEFIPKVINAKDVDEYYYTLMEFSTLLDNSHTSVLPPWGYFKPGHDMPPLEVAIIADKFYIKRIGANEEIDKLVLGPGIELLEINGIAVNEYFKENVLKYYSQGSKQANDAILPVYLLNGPVSEKVELKIKDLDSKERNVVLSRKSANSDGDPFLYEFVNNIFVENSITVKKFKESILYVKIPNFENEQIGLEFQELINSEDFTSIQGMILDVRKNMGGSSKVCNQIVECLINEPVIAPLMVYPEYSAAKKAWGRKESWNTSENTINPREGKKYLGPLVILTDGVTNSSAEDLAIELTQTQRATIVGQQTAGGAGNILKVNLPFGGTFNLATFKALLPKGTDYMGIGIEPDVVVEPNVDEIINGVDSTLSTAISLLTKHENE